MTSENTRTFTVEIDKGIPIPESRGRGGISYPWKQMEVGDSFLLRDPKLSRGSNISQANRLYAPKRFTTRVINEGGRRVRRVWRVA